MTDAPSKSQPPRVPSLREAGERPALPDGIAPHIILERERLVVVNKPAGWPTSGRDLHDPGCVQYLLMECEGRMVWAVHQLDADTTGVNVFVTRKSWVHPWQQRLRWPNAEKEYLALCHGEVSAPLRLDGALGHRGDGRRAVVSEGGRAALTLVEPLATTAQFSLVRCRLRTGRTHQIRIHLADAGHPLVGEWWYREPGCELAPRHMLHARRVVFRDGEEPTCFEAPMPADMRDTCARLGLALPEAS